MIKLSKGNQPQSLQRNAVQWKNDLMAYVNRNEKPPQSVYNKYNQDDVKDQLRNECFSKCMYCESSVGHIAHEHIEHIKPKAVSKYPQHTFDWDNLGLACPKCNGNKGDMYDHSLPFINPYIEEPSDHLVYAGAFVLNLNGSQRGELTIEELKLNRLELMEKRGEKIRLIKNLIDKFCNQPNGALKDIYKQQIIDEMDNKKEFSVMIRGIVKAMAPNDFV